MICDQVVAIHYTLLLCLDQLGVFLQGRTQPDAGLYSWGRIADTIHNDVAVDMH